MECARCHSSSQSSQGIMPHPSSRYPNGLRWSAATKLHSSLQFGTLSLPGPRKQKAQRFMLLPIRYHTIRIHEISCLSRTTSGIRAGPRAPWLCNICRHIHRCILCHTFYIALSAIQVFICSVAVQYEVYIGEHYSTNSPPDTLDLSSNTCLQPGRDSSWDAPQVSPGSHHGSSPIPPIFPKRTA